ncbi:MAG: DUF3365 domain-containing protein [Nitrospiraceae bacterium]
MYTDCVRPVVVVALALLLCGNVVSSAQAEEVSREQAAAAVASAFVKELGEAMAAQMAKSGPTEAIAVCAELAPKIAGRLSREHGWKVTRVGTRVRNPLIGWPDAWEQQGMADFAARLAKGEEIASLQMSAEVTEPAGRSFRYLKAIGVQPRCLLCHGPVETIPPQIRELLAAQYPHDRAVGYKPGELRGAVSIVQPVNVDR